MRYRVLATWQNGYFVYYIVDNQGDIIVYSYSTQDYRNAKEEADAVCGNMNDLQEAQR